MKKSLISLRASSAAAAALMLLLLLVPATEAAISCSDIVKDLAPCLNYLMSGSGKPSVSCCSGASKVKAAASTTSDTRAACNCLKSTAKQLNVNSAAATALPGKCGISLPFTVSATTDCSKIG